MTNKTILRWATACSLVLCLSCTKGKEQPDPTPTPDPQKDPDKITLSTAASLVQPCDASSFTLSFTTNASWTVTSGVTWCRVSPASGNAGSASVTVSLDANEAYDERSCAIVIKAGIASEAVSVTQKQKDALIISASKQQIDAKGGNVSVEVRANIEYSISSDADWITDITTRALTSRTHTFQVSENTEYDGREGHITISSGELEEVVTVVQDGSAPYLSISRSEIVVGSAESAQAIEISANIPVTVSFGADWLSGEESVTAAGTYTFTVQENASPDQREADIRFSNEEYGLAEVLHIIQAQNDALVVAKDYYEFGSEGGTLEMEISTNVELAYSIADDAKSWINYVQTKAMSSKTMVFSIAKADETVNRTGSITISGGDLSFSVTVRQINKALDDAVYFEDAEFKRYCTERFDANSDGEISFREALAIQSVDIRTDNVHSLVGIEAFKNLQSLNASGKEWGTGQLESLDLSQNTALRYIIVPNNHLKSLTLPAGAPLTDIVAYCNEISSYKLGSYETLETISIGANGNVTELELPLKADNLRTLYIDNDNVSSVDISAYGALVSFYCHGNPLPRLSIRSNPKITDLNCNCPSMKVLFVTPQQAIEGVTVNRSTDHIHEDTVIWTGDPADYKETVDVESVTLDVTEKTLKVGECFTLTATVLPDNATDKTVTWTSSNPDIAKVSDNGEVTAIAEGSAVITASAGSAFASCTVNVEAYVPVSAITLDRVSVTMSIGESITLGVTISPANASDKTVQWSSKDITVASVDNSGLVTALGAGSTTIVATSGDISAECMVLVEEDGIPENEIWYTTTDNNIIQVNNVSNLESNTYEGGHGKLRFSSAIYSIPSGMWRECSTLQSIKLPKDIVKIEDSAFYGCKNLSEVSLSIGLKEIGRYAFYDCDNLSNILLPDRLLTIGQYAFDECSNLSAITIPKSVSSLESYAFASCKNLASLTIEDSSVDLSMGWYVFAHCDELVSVNIPARITYLSNATFEGCKKLQTVHLPDGLTTIGTHAFFECPQLKNIVLPSSVNRIDPSAFEKCTSLTDITIPQKVDRLNTALFKGCSALKAIKIIGDITSIEDEVFYGCSSMIEITIPASVTRINKDVFALCRSLSKVILKPTTPPEKKNGLYEETNDAKYFVPAGSLDAYKTASGWSEFAYRIYAMEE